MEDLYAGDVTVDPENFRINVIRDTSDYRRKRGLSTYFVVITTEIKAKLIVFADDLCSHFGHGLSGRSSLYFQRDKGDIQH